MATVLGWEFVKIPPFLSHLNPWGGFNDESWKA